MYFSPSLIGFDPELALSPMYFSPSLIGFDPELASNVL